jgi:lysophospholipase L1-like esterase
VKPCGLAILLAVICPAVLARAEGFDLKPGDRVALVGSTLIEREQQYGYWELALTVRFPGVTFRNLGWSGDTVWGESRVAFDLDQPQKGFDRLVNAVLAVKPSVILVGYGTNESFAGEAGLPRFKEGLNKLLDAFAPTKARVVLLAPLPFEKHGRMLPDPAPANRNLAIYTAALREVARQRHCHFVDLGPRIPTNEAHTEDGMHLTALGYAITAPLLAQALANNNPSPTLLREDGTLAPEADKLRLAIIEKNRLFFHRYRPQNETYLFGFRKYEQGKNAVEVPQFDALIEQREKEIAKLRSEIIKK